MDQNYKEPFSPLPNVWVFRRVRKIVYLIEVEKRNKQLVYLINEWLCCTVHLFVEKVFQTGFDPNITTHIKPYCTDYYYLYLSMLSLFS